MKKFTRRELMALGLAAPALARAQGLRLTAWQAMVLQTIHEADFHPQFTKTGRTLYWKWPDGSYTSSNSPTKTLAAGTKRIVAESQDGFKAVTEINIAAMHILALPSLAGCSGLTSLTAYSNAGMTGDIASLPAGLMALDCGNTAVSGSIVDLPTGLMALFCGSTAVTGSIASLPAGLIYLGCGSTAVTGPITSRPFTYFNADTSGVATYTAGAFATQANLSTINVNNCGLLSTVVNAILADLVTSLSVPSRVIATVTLAGNNQAPTGQGLVDKATLVAAGWTVTTS